VVLFEPEPEGIHDAYQTIAHSASIDIQAKAQQLVDAIEAAAGSEQLCIEGRRNATTGARGVVVGAGRPGGAVTVLAELLNESQLQLTDAAKDRFDFLGWAALNKKLSVLVHAPEPGAIARVAFAVLVSSEGDSLGFYHLARLLVNEVELAQWDVASIA
jgi:hypothetical protein